MVTDVDAVARGSNRTSGSVLLVAGAVIEEVERVVTTRGRAHGRGRWTGHETSEPFQHRLF
ncbi:hypothetical protein ACFQV8_01095 [Pseudonocardia benzenivorans]